MQPLPRVDVARAFIIIITHLGRAIDLLSAINLMMPVGTRGNHVSSNIVVLFFCDYVNDTVRQRDKATKTILVFADDSSNLSRRHPF